MKIGTMELNLTIYAGAFAFHIRIKTADPLYLSGCVLDSLFDIYDDYQANSRYCV